MPLLLKSSAPGQELDSTLQEQQAESMELQEPSACSLRSGSVEQQRGALELSWCTSIQHCAYCFTGPDISLSQSHGWSCLLAAQGERCVVLCQAGNRGAVPSCLLHGQGSFAKSWLPRNLPSTFLWGGRVEGACCGRGLHLSCQTIPDCSLPSLTCLQASRGSCARQHPFRATRY